MRMLQILDKISGVLLSFNSSPVHLTLSSEALHLRMILAELQCVMSTLPCVCPICFFFVFFLIEFLFPTENLSSLTDRSIYNVFPLSTDSQRSHLSSFTMKLMDKFHSPKIKRTPSKKGKQLQPEPAAKSTEKPANKVCVQKTHLYCGKFISVPPLSPYSPCLFAYLLPDCFPVLMFCALIFHCVGVCASIPAGSHSFPVAVAAGCATAGV